MRMVRAARLPLGGAVVLGTATAVLVVAQAALIAAAVSRAIMDDAGLGALQGGQHRVRLAAAACLVGLLLRGGAAPGERALVSRTGPLVLACGSRIEALPIPTVISIQGLCLAGGLELMLACDIAFCSETARFGDQHVNFGFLPAWAWWTDSDTSASASPGIPIVTCCRDPWLRCW